MSEESDFVITSYIYYTDSECQQFGYRAKGLLKSVTDPEGNTATYTYDTYGNVATVEDPETHMMTRYEYNSIGWMEAEISRKDYRTEYDYDKNGRLIRSTLGGGETTRIVYNPTGQVIQEVSPNLYSALYDDINNNIYTGDHGTRYTYYPTGDIRAITDAAGNTTAYTYDMYGNIKTETKPNGAVYTYDYDLLNRKIKTWFREDAQSDDVLLEEYEYRILSDKKTQTVKKVYINDAETLTTIYTSDYAGRLLTQQNPDGTVQSHEYNPNGTLKSTTDPRGNTTYYKYDGQNRLSEQWSPVENNGGVKYSYKKITYDSAGRQKQISIGRELVSLYNVPSTFAATNFTYYRNGLLKSKADNEGRRTEYRYDSDGNLAAEDIYIDDETFETTEYENNHMGKPVEERKYIRKGDLYGNPFNDNDTEIIYTWFTYDNNGNLKTVTNHKGITTTYDYDNMNRQLSVSMPGEDEYGMPVTIRNASQYNWEGKVICTEDANGNVTGYEYNKRGLLTRVINAESGVTAFWYDRAGRVTAEVTPEHYDESKSLSQMTRKEYTYDSMGRVLAETEVCYDESKSQWISLVSKAYQYDANGNITKELDALGHEYGTGSTIRQKISTGYGTEYTYNLNNQVISILDPVSKQKGLSYRVKYAYDALGRVITETNAKGHIISYEYDDAGNLLKKEIQRDANSPKQVLETYNYDYIGRLISKTDGNQNTIYFEYNGFNKLKKEIHPGDESIPRNVILYQYDESGNLKLMENSPGTQDIYTYDNLNRQTSHTSQKYDGSGKITTSVKYDPNGNVRFETNGNGNTTEKTYDAMNRLKEVKITVSGILQTTAYSYDKNGNLIKETDWRNNSHTYTYDSLNRLIEKRDPYGKVIEWLEYNNNHAQVKSCDALGNLTQYVYDRNNRLIKTIDPENNEITQAYDHLGNVSTHTDGRGNITCYYYDEMNRLEKVVNAKGEITEYTYDPNGNMLTQKDGNGHITTYEYNCANLVVRRIDHGGRAGTPGNYTYDLAKVESYTYNEDGTLATRTDRNGEATSYTYDNHGRLISETTSGSTVSFTYDNNSNQLTVTDITGTTARTYDELNRVTSKTVPDIGTVYHEYDIIDGVETGETAERTIDPKGNVTTKIYDRAGRLKIVIDGSLSTGQRTVYEYHDNGSRASITYPTGIREEYTYYPDNTLWTLTNKYSDGTVMDVYTYTYDSANNQVSKHEVINGVNKGTTSYTYDTLNRLLKVTEPTGKVTAYTYDMAGNRLTETITSNSETIKNTYSYNEQNRLEDILTRVNNVVTELTSFTYDNNGNQLETIMTEYVDGSPQSPATTVTNIYDKRNQLIQTITSDGTSVTNGYNGEGLRVSKTVNGQTAYYLYEYDKVVLEVNSSGDQKARNLYGTNLLMRTVDNETYYYIYNGHADVTALISTDGSIAATYYYDAFGNILEQTGDVDNNITYAGYQYDFETGLYYLNARMYDPKIARFLQEDTYRGNPNDPLSLNLYTYCNNNPLVYYDPTGHWPEWLDKGFEYFKSGFNTLFLKSEEERQEDFNLIYDHGGNDTYTKAITNIGGGLAEAGDFWKDPVAQMEENNQKLIMPFVTDTLGVQEDTFAYKVINSVITSAEAFSVSGVDMIKGTVNTGFMIGNFIGNRTLLKINTVGLATGHVSAEQYLGNIETVINDTATMASMPGAMVTGIKNSVVNLATNGLDFFRYDTSLAEKSQLVTDFTTAVGTAEAAYGLYKLAKPYISALRQRVSSSNWYKSFASEQGGVSIGTEGASNALGGSQTTTYTLDEALQQLDKSGLRPGQDVLSKSQLNSVLDSITNNYNPSEAYSSIYNDGVNRCLVDGHHTTVAFKMLGKNSGPNMNIGTSDLPSAMNIYWTKKWYQFGRKAIKIID